MNATFEPCCTDQDGDTFYKLGNGYGLAVWPRLGEPEVFEAQPVQFFGDVAEPCPPRSLALWEMKLERTSGLDHCGVMNLLSWLDGLGEPRPSAALASLLAVEDKPATKAKAKPTSKSKRIKGERT